MQLVIECLGLNTYHGYTASLMRKAVDMLKGNPTDRSPELSLSFITSLFSLVYHIAGAENGAFYEGNFGCNKSNV